MTETGSDDFATAPAPPLHADFTMDKAHAQFNGAMAEVQPASAPLSVFQQAQEEQRYNLFFLELKEICPRGNNKVIIYFLIS